MSKKIKQKKVKRTESDFQPIHLHLHTSYSIGDSVVHIDKLMDRVKELGMDSVALTDHGSLSGMLKFYKAAKKVGVKPIIGEEFYVKDDREEQQKMAAERREKRKKNEEVDDTYTYDPNQHLVVLAKNWDGLQDIFKIHGDAVRNGFYYRPRTTHDIIKEYAGNIVVSTACMAGKSGVLIREGKFKECERFLSSMKEAFKDDFYIELQFNEISEQHVINEKLLEFSKKLKIPFIITNDVHYLNKEDNEVHDIHKLINRRRTVNSNDLESVLFDARELYLKDRKEFVRSAKKWGYNISTPLILEGLERTIEVANKCNIIIPLNVIKFPKYYPDPKNPDPNFDPVAYLREKVNKGFRRRLEQGLIPKGKVKEYIERGKYELDVIIRKEYMDYFLIVSDYTDMCRERRIFKGGGRGSAAGSVVAWFIGITEVDPIKNGLIFERFLNEDRADPPDIDQDFDSDRRHEIEEYLIEKYGEEKIAHIISFGTYGKKGVVRDVGRVMELPYRLVDKLANELDMSESTFMENIEKIKDECSDKEILDFISKNDKFLEYCSKLEGIVRHYSKHAGGTVVTPGPLEHYIPIMRVKDSIVTGLQEGGDEREMSDMGVLKLDILGLNWCRILRRAIDMVKERHGIDYMDKIWSIDYDDPKLMAEFAKANTKDIFQYSSRPMRDFMQKVAGTLDDERLGIKADPTKATVEGTTLKFSDLVAINAGWRPAVILSGATDIFASNKHKKPSEIEYLHPTMKKALKETYGALIYQEQFMNILMDTANFTAAEADKSRKTLKYLNKGKHDTESDSYKEFTVTLNRLKKEWKRNGFTDEQIEEISQVLAKFIDYSFNKSHSCSYAQAAVQGMFLKVYYPIEFFTALLQSTDNAVKKDSKGRKHRDKYPLEEFIQMIRENNVKVLPPLVSKSKENFEIESDDSIRSGLTIIKGCGEKAAVTIVKNQPYNSIEDFFASKIDWRACHKGVIEILIKAGAFDDLYSNRKVLLKAFAKYNEYKGKVGSKGIKDKTKTFRNYIEKAEKEIKDDFTPEEKLNLELEMFGFYFSEHPFDKYKDVIKKKNFVTPSEALERKRKFILAGYVLDTRVIKTKYGDSMAFVEVADNTGTSVSVTVWPEQWRVYKKDLKVGNAIAIKVKPNKPNEKYKDSLVINDINDGKRLVISLDKFMK